MDAQHLLHTDAPQNKGREHHPLQSTKHRPWLKHHWNGSNLRPRRNTKSAHDHPRTTQRRTGKTPAHPEKKPKKIQERKTQEPKAPVPQQIQAKGVATTISPQPTEQHPDLDKQNHKDLPHQRHKNRNCQIRHSEDDQPRDTRHRIPAGYPLGHPNKSLHSSPGRAQMHLLQQKKQQTYPRPREAKIEVRHKPAK